MVQTKRLTPLSASNPSKKHKSNRINRSAGSVSTTSIDLTMKYRSAAVDTLSPDIKLPLPACVLNNIMDGIHSDTTCNDLGLVDTCKASCDMNYTENILTPITNPVFCPTPSCEDKIEELFSIIRGLEVKISKLALPSETGSSSSSSTSPRKLPQTVNLINYVATEVYQRVVRRKNIIVYNIPDNAQINKVRSTLLNACSMNNVSCSCHRLRKSQKNKSCPLVFKFDSSSNADIFYSRQTLLKNTRYHTIKLARDKTPIQRITYMTDSKTVDPSSSTTPLSTHNSVEAEQKGVDLSIQSTPYSETNSRENVRSKNSSVYSRTLRRKSTVDLDSSDYDPCTPVTNCSTSHPALTNRSSLNSRKLKNAATSSSTKTMQNKRLMLHTNSNAHSSIPHLSSETNIHKTDRYKNRKTEPEPRRYLSKKVNPRTITNQKIDTLNYRTSNSGDVNRNNSNQLSLLGRPPPPIYMPTPNRTDHPAINSFAETTLPFFIQVHNMTSNILQMLTTLHRFRPPN